MIQVYVLVSLKSSIYYVGNSQDVDKRLIEHNSGKSKFTKGHLPWRHIYQESQDDYSSVRKREKYWKSVTGTYALRYLFKY